MKEKFYIFFGYYGAFIIFRISVSYIYKFLCFLSTRKTFKSPYLKNAFNNHDNFKKCDNYVLLNFNCLSEEIVKNHIPIDLIKEGFKILIIIERNHKYQCKIEKAKFIQKYKLNNEVIVIKSIKSLDSQSNYEHSVIHLNYSDQIKKKINQFNCFNKYISIIINYMVNTDNKNFNQLEKQIIFTKICLEKILMNRGNSILMNFTESQEINPSLFKFVKRFTECLKIEYKNKIEIYFTFLKNRNLDINIKNILYSYSPD